MRNSETNVLVNYNSYWKTSHAKRDNIFKHINIYIDETWTIALALGFS